MSAPVVTVAVPSFRRPRQLREAIGSVIAQDGIDPSTYEIVIIDNCPECSADWVVSAFPGQWPALRYVHEPRRGYAHARNRAVAEARGQFLAFLDDDETAERDWLSQLLVVLQSTGADAAFGPVRAVYDRANEMDRVHLDKIFARQLRLPEGSDLRSKHMRLGTGNSIFRMQTCFDSNTLFDEAGNRMGGEDTLFIRSLIDRSRLLVWAPQAVVDEHVPAERCQLTVLLKRRFQQGKMRSYASWSGPRRTGAGVAFWMLAGAIQGTLYSLVSGGLRLVRQPHLADLLLVRAYGGWGKLLWWRTLSAQRQNDVDQSALPAQGGTTSTFPVRKAASR